MAEVGLVPFARLALEIASAFSKHQFTQPQLLALLCVMRRLDLPRGRGAAERAPRIASSPGSGRGEKGRLSWRIHGVRAKMRRRFPRKVYAQRAIIEAVICCAQRKLSAPAPGRTEHTQSVQALVLGVAFNVDRLSC